MSGCWGDLIKTDRLIQLCEVPHQKRDENWREQFLASLSGARFTV